MCTETGRSSGPRYAKPRRSRACNTCRQRKVKCDERFPTCRRCEKSSRRCLGYSNPLIFVNMVTSEAEPPGDGDWDAMGSENMALSNGVRGDSSSADSDHYEDILVRPSIHLGAYRPQIVMSHLIFKLAIRVDNSPSYGVDAPTLSTVLTKSDHASVAYLAGLSFGEAFFGRVHKLNSMVDHSVQLYNYTLQNLRKNLQLFSHEMNQPRAYESLWSTVLLGMYELVASTGTSNWLEHSRGLCALTELLGPLTFQRPGAHELLTTFRTNMVIACILDRKTCFLERLEWKTIPWARRAQRRSLGDRLRDLFCDLPGILEQAKTGPFDSTLHQRITRAIQRTDHLRWRWGLLYSKACWERPLDLEASLSLDDKGEPLFDTVLEFEEAERAVEILYFNAIRLMLFAMSDEAGLHEPVPWSDDNIHRFHGPRLNADILPEHGTRMSHTLEICRVVDYFMVEQRAGKGAMILFFPLSVARTHLQHAPWMSSWVGRILGEVSSSKGWKFGEGVANV